MDLQVIKPIDGFLTQQIKDQIKLIELSQKSIYECLKIPKDYDINKISNLPNLIKIPDKDYTIAGVKSFDKELEISTFCIGHGKGNNFIVSSSFELKNKRSLRAFDYYCNSLSDFYNCKILIEKS